MSQVEKWQIDLCNFKRTEFYLLVGHVTKQGAIAGPKVLEHLVDTVIYFEGDGGSQLRALRAVKNRFGSTGEMGFLKCLSRDW